MRPSASMVVASLALFVALSGTSYAVSQLPAKSVGTKQLQRSSVTGVKVKDGSLTARDFKAGALPAGPAQSAFASTARKPSYRIPRGPDFTPMFSLTEFADVSTGPLRISAPSRLTITAAISTQSGSVRFTSRLTCRFDTRDGGGWRPTLSEVQTVTQMREGDWLPMVASVDVAAGTTDVRLVCRSDDAEGVLFDRGHFAVVVTDR